MKLPLFLKMEGERLRFIYSRNYCIADNSWIFSFKGLKFPDNVSGAVAIEYVLSMTIAAVVMIGVDKLFEKMSFDIISAFIGWVQSPYP